MSAFVDAFRFFGQGIEVLEIPSWDCLPYDRSGPSGGVSARRMSALARLASGSVQGDTVLIATTIAAASQRLPPREAVAGAGYAARIGNTVDVADLERYFAVNGYHRASTVSEKGEFAIRGGVIDVFPTASSEPVRLDLFGDTLESIRAFDPETQRSTRQLSEVSLLPVSEILLDAAAVSSFRRGYVEAFGAPGGDPLYDTVSGGGRRAGMEHWLPLFYGALETLFDYLPEGLLVGMDALVESALAERFAQVADAFEARDQADRRSQYRPLSPDALYLSPEAFADALAVRSVRRFSGLSGKPGSIAVDMGARSGRSFAAERRQDSVNLFEATVAHARALTVAGKRVLFASWTEGSSERLGLMLADHGLGQAALAPYWDAARANDPRQPQRIVLPLEAGFETPDLAVIAETDILGDRLARLALARTYGMIDVECESPIYAAMSRAGAAIRVTFTGCPDGLMMAKKAGLEPARETPAGTLSQFAIAGADHQFVWADARIDGNDTVIVSSRAVAEPVAVRYAWGLNPAGANLYGRNGLPASPFRTDDWPLPEK
jgi:transcription-repair coupling factor (superfamily II helicase)